MLPEFNKYGNLPAGVYKSSISCIENKFGTSSEERISLFNDFRKFLKMLSPFKKNIKRLILDGSFVTSKESPGDIDCIMIINNNFRFIPEIVEELGNSKELYNIHLFMFEEKNIESCRGMLNFFSKDKDLKPKGIIEVIL
ncbi:hypothetical protein KKA86_05495 [bacterium]|nr:hypothetical protein [bacterium]MCG2821778.1 hypothetical protein [Candidatus Atribacteria bacterium]